MTEAQGELTSPVSGVAIPRPSPYAPNPKRFVIIGSRDDMGRGFGTAAITHALAALGKTTETQKQKRED